MIFILVIILLVAVIVALVAQDLTLNQNDKKGDYNPINVGSSPVNFTAWELQTWIGIKNRLLVNNTDPNFAGIRTLQWISMRNSSSLDYYQKSMEFLCFWQGRGADGEWEAVVSIYNSPNSTSDFVVEVSRFTWHQLKVFLDGNFIAEFPQVTNDTVSLGYATFRVTPMLAES